MWRHANSVALHAARRVGACVHFARHHAVAPSICRAFSTESSSSSTNVASALGSRSTGDFSDTRPFPTQARVVIIGGGVVGCSVAYHLAKLGWGKDVLLLESGQISCGTTWHAAGLIGQMRSTASETLLSGVYGCKLYSELESETGVATGFRRVGSLTLARTADRMTLLRRNAARARAYGIDAEMVSGEEAGRLWSKEGVEMKTSDLHGALWLPGDGTATSTDLCASLAAGAKQRGVRIFERAAVTGIDLDETPRASLSSPGSSTRGEKRIRGVRTSRGDVACEIVVNCGGQWSRQIGALAGVNVPLHSAEHFYVVTQALNLPVTPNLPVMRDPDVFVYYREWSGGLVMGGFEPRCKPVFDGPQGVPPPGEFEFALLEEDWDHFSTLMPGALERVPALATAGVRMVNGPESFTPDNQYILGESPELRRFYVAAGFNSSGIASAGGAGRAIAEWIVEDEPTLDLWSVDIRRFGRFHANGHFLRDRTFETLGLHYQIPWPKREMESGRPLRRSALYSQLLESGAYMGSKFGWERANFFDPSFDKRRKPTTAAAAAAASVSATPAAPVAPVSSSPPSSLSSGADVLVAPLSSSTAGPKMEWSFGPPNWLPFTRAEHLACRTGVAVFDQSSFAKILVQGRDACALLQEACANEMDVPDGRIVYTPMLNKRGGIESDFTVTRVAWDEYLVVTSAAQGTKDLAWLKRLVGQRCVTLTDVTPMYAVLSVMGPRSRELLTRASGGRARLDNQAAPFGTSVEIEVGYATVRAARVTYVGELGWELYVPVELAAAAYEALWRASRGDGSSSQEDLGLVAGGYFAIDSLRLEKGYRAWGSDLTPDRNPDEAGLGFAVRIDKNAPFIGQEALKQQRVARGGAPPSTRLVAVRFRDPAAYPHGDEPLWRDGHIVGRLTSAVWGHTLERGVGLAYITSPSSSKDGGRLTPVTAEWLAQEDATHEVELDGRRFRVDLSLKPFYDPTSARVKA